MRCGKFGPDVRSTDDDIPPMIPPYRKYRRVLHVRYRGTIDTCTTVLLFIVDLGRNPSRNLPRAATPAGLHTFTVLD